MPTLNRCDDLGQKLTLHLRRTSQTTMATSLGRKSGHSFQEYQWESYNSPGPLSILVGS